MVREVRRCDKNAAAHLVQSICYAMAHASVGILSTGSDKNQDGEQQRCKLTNDFDPEMNSRSKRGTESEKDSMG